MSVTHIALGTVRVEATLSTAGQAAGTAAALAIRHRATPREVGQRYIGELQQQLLKDDQYIPELKNEDPADLARGATVTASSTQRFSEFTRKQVKTDDEHALNMPRAVMFPRGLTERLGTVQLCLISTNVDPVEVTLHVRGADAADDFSASKDLAAVTANSSPSRDSASPPTTGLRMSSMAYRASSEKRATSGHRTRSSRCRNGWSWTSASR